MNPKIKNSLHERPAKPEATRPPQVALSPDVMLEIYADTTRAILSNPNVNPIRTSAKEIAQQSSAIVTEMLDLVNQSIDLDALDLIEIQKSKNADN